MTKFISNEEKRLKQFIFYFESMIISWFYLTNINFEKIKNVIKL